MEIEDVARFLINPLLYVLLGIILLIFIKKHRLKIALLLIAYFYLMSITFTGHIFSKVWKVNETFDPNISYDAVVVLAGVSDPEWHIDRDGLTYIPQDIFATCESTDRIFAGIYFVKAKNAKLLLIGNWVYEKNKQGVYKKYSEGMAVQKLVSEKGIKDDQIWIYGKVNRTLDEVEGINKFITSHRVEKFLLVTSEMHMRRALAMFRKKGLHPDIFSVNKEIEITWESFIPSVSGIVKTESCLHEFVGYIGYHFMGNL
jgi:uncharacterized SAM-binding protein YcdF (DUF218 family)